MNTYLKYKADTNKTQGKKSKNATAPTRATSRLDISACWAPPKWIQGPSRWAQGKTPNNDLRWMAHSWNQVHLTWHQWTKMYSIVIQHDPAWSCVEHQTCRPNSVHSRSRVSTHLGLKSVPRCSPKEPEWGQQDTKFSHIDPNLT